MKLISNQNWTQRLYQTEKSQMKLISNRNQTYKQWNTENREWKHKDPQLI